MAECFVQINLLVQRLQAWVVERLEVCVNARQDVQRIPQGGKVTRAGRTERDTAGDTFDVANAAQGVEQVFVVVLLK